MIRAPSESGQTLIIVLLVVLVSLAVGVGVATRSTSTVQQTTFSEEATQALHFAEACAEEALGKIKTGDITESNLPCGNLDYTATDNCSPLDVDDDGSSDDCCYEVSALSEIFPGVISQDDAAEVKLGGFSGSITVYWCNSDSSSQECAGANPPAIELVLVKDGVVERLAYAHPASARGDNFSSGEVAGETVNGVTFAYKISSIAIADVRAVRVIPRYNDSSVAVVPVAGVLPHQGYKITAKGDFGRSTRTVEVTKTEPAMPAIFDYVLFSGSETEPLEKK